MLKQDPSN